MGQGTRIRRANVGKKGGTNKREGTKRHGPRAGHCHKWEKSKKRNGRGTRGKDLDRKKKKKGQQKCTSKGGRVKGGRQSIQEGPAAKESKGGV